MTSPSIRANRGTVVEAWRTIDRSDWELVPQFFAPGYVRHTGGESHDLDAFIQAAQELRDGFAMEILGLDQLTCDEHRVAFHWTTRAEHHGHYLGLPPTRRRVTLSGITISRLDGGRIAEDWSSWNKLDLLRSLGIMAIDGR